MWQPQVAVTYQSKQTDIKLLRLLMVFADRADENGRIDPAPNQDTLAELFSVSDRTIRSWINLLIDSGELTRTRRGRGDGNASAYQINLNIPQSGQVIGSYTEEKPAFTSGNLEERLGNLEETVASLQEVIGYILPVIENLQEEQEALIGITGSVNRKGNSCKSADDPLRSIIDPEEVYINAREAQETLEEAGPEITPFPEQHEIRQEMISAISGEVKETFALGITDTAFNGVADGLLGRGVKPEQVRGFNDWWESNGFYPGKPALKSLLAEFDNFINGISRKPKMVNGRVQQESLNKVVGEF